MTTYMSPRQQAERTDHAVHTATGAARELGLTVTDPRVLHDVFSVVVHLAPAPVVARVPTVLPHTTTLHDLALRQQDELNVTRWLADQGLPVLEPSPLLPARPLQRQGLSMTFWTFVEQADDVEPDYVANAESTADLHAALRSYPAALSYLSTAEPAFVTDALTRLGEHPDLITPDDLDRAHREWDLLHPLVRSQAAFQERFGDIDLQPIHGDSPPANIFHSTRGDLYADFEMLTLGPVEWDLAALGPECEAAYDRGARRNGLRTLNPDVSRFVNAIGMLRAIAHLTLVPELPTLNEALQPAVEHWRTLPFAGGHTP
ncbi:MAG TPA: aminoglycoside phosphotransferase family protein [Nocardiopsis listeri]|uniref:phosphotransferase n=1 Tax=Nocardiopsis listeri TaxID=53440 RepID=UPI001D982B19|nr:phosphotransferase [Nocardiopsis listeri]HJE60465.1 aminoglycoside phosphotransferase family protein [Nocardiopsis listeri]